jgi:hypothetical protein
MRPDASENSQISPSTIVRAARTAGSHPRLASVLQQGWKSANIRPSLGVNRGIPVHWGKRNFLIVREKGSKKPADLGGDIYALLADKVDIGPIERVVSGFMAAL